MIQAERLTEAEKIRAGPPFEFIPEADEKMTGMGHLSVVGNG